MNMWQRTRRKRFRAWVAVVFLVTWAGCGVVLGAGSVEGSRVRVTFSEVDTIFANPGQGWMSQQRRPEPRPRFPCSVVYIRFDWAAAEPEMGEYNWKLIDDVIAAWRPHGAAVAMRVMTCNAHSAGYYASPKWLFDAGCKGYEYVRGGDDPTSGGERMTRIEPEYGDPIYLERHGAFIEALGGRYDGHPDVEFVDIGSYGIWGEWHTPNPAPVSVRKEIVDAYVRAFRRTPLVFMSDDAEVLGYALERGSGIRRDGVGSPWHEENWIGSRKYAGVVGMAGAWRRAPVVFEWFGNYDYLVSRGWSFEGAVRFMLEHHVTLINDNIGRVPAEAMPELEELARRAGYRFVLREVTYEGAVRRGGRLEVRMEWGNVGVGKLYRPYEMVLYAVDSAGEPALRWVSAADPRGWLPGTYRVVEMLDVPQSAVAGEYALEVALEDGVGNRRPLRLGMDATEVNGVYGLGRLRIVE